MGFPLVITKYIQTVNPSAEFTPSNDRAQTDITLRFAQDNGL